MCPTCGDPEATRTTNATHASNASTWGHWEEGCTRGRRHPRAAAGRNRAREGTSSGWPLRGEGDTLMQSLGWVPHTGHTDQSALWSLLLGDQVWPPASLRSPVRASAPACRPGSRRNLSWPRLPGDTGSHLPQTPPPCPALTSFCSSLERRGRGGSREHPPGKGGSREHTRSTCGENNQHQHP